MLSSVWVWLNVVLALVGPAIVAILGAPWSSGSPAIIAHLPGLLAIALIVLGVYAIAIYREGYTLHCLGFGQISWWTPLLALVLAAFFVVGFGPIAYWMLARLGAGSFDAGLAATEKLPRPI